MAISARAKEEEQIGCHRLPGSDPGRGGQDPFIQRQPRNQTASWLARLGPV